MATAHKSTSTSAPGVWRGFEAKTLPEVPSWIETLGRLGFIAKGVVYFIIGFLAFKLAIGAGGEISGSREAIQEVGQQPFGRLLLGLMAIGLLGYTAWRWVQAAKDTEGDGSDAKGIVKRIGYLVSGIAYLLLGFFAGSKALGISGSQGNSETSTQPLLESTWGQVILFVAGVITVCVALYFIVKAYKAKFMTKYKLSQMSETARKVALHVGRMGLATRGVAFAIVGGFLVTTVAQGFGEQQTIDSGQNGQVAGLSDALAFIATQAYGKILIGITGFGLMCYGVHMFLMSRYRRFNVN